MSPVVTSMSICVAATVLFARGCSDEAPAAPLPTPAPVASPSSVPAGAPTATPSPAPSSSVLPGPPAITPVVSGTPPAKARLDVNDVSWLLPPPRDVAAIDQLITLGTIKAGDGTPVWPEDAFKGLVSIADGDGALVQGDRRIRLPAEVRSQSVWKVTALRIDPSAPGTSPAIIEKFGSIPQIRLIVQPVTAVGGQVKVHDIAVHVVYSYALGVQPTDDHSFPRILPDNGKFQQIVSDLVALKKMSADAGAGTAGVPLGVHPGLLNPTQAPKLISQLKIFLSTHLQAGRLQAMAIMGLPNSFEPWIFVAVSRNPKTGGLTAVPSPGLAVPPKTAQMLSFQDTPHVLPVPAANNRSPITGEAFVPPAQRRGVATAVLFENGLNKDAPALLGKDASGAPVTDPTAKNRDIPDVVANPDLSHFFNTDCLSCHTESTRRQTLGFGASPLAFIPPAGVSGLSKDLGPGSQKWNVRNFGWFQSDFVKAPALPTATQRTANETMAVVDFINKNFQVQSP